MTSSTNVGARPNRELVVYGLYAAGGASQRVHTEEVALKCWTLFPTAFSWTKYPQYPDKDIVRVALTDARKEKYGALVIGRVEGLAHNSDEPEGWLLTEGGLQWIADNRAAFEAEGADPQRKAHRQLLLRRVREITASDLFRAFQRDREAFAPGIGELASFLKCRVDANQNIWERRLGDIRRLSIDTAESEIGTFAEACSRAYEAQR
jgi:hypothetical protein